MLTSFTLIRGIKRTVGAKGGEGAFRWAAGSRKLATNVASNTRWKRGRDEEREEETEQRKSQVAGVREEKGRIEARRNRGIGRRKETSKGGHWAKLEGFLCKRQWINGVKLMKSRGLETTSAQMLTLSSGPPSLPTMSPSLVFNSSLHFTLPSVMLPFQSLTPALPSWLLSTPTSSFLHLLSTLFPPHLLSLSSLSPFPPLLPLLTAGTVQISVGNYTADRLCWHWRQHFTGSSACRTLLQCWPVCKMHKGK